MQEKPVPGEGPYLTMAVLCEKVLREQDGVLSVIRIIDRLTHTVIGSSLPDTLPPFDHQLVAALSFKSGQARGRAIVRVVIEQPSGMRLPQEIVQHVHFEGAERGINVLADLSLRLSQEGLYWFDVFLDDRLFTRIPLRVVYQPTPVGQ